MKISDLVYNPIDVRDEEYVPHTSVFLDSLAAKHMAKEIGGIMLPCGCVHGPHMLADLTIYCQDGHYIG